MQTYILFFFDLNIVRVVLFIIHTNMYTNINIQIFYNYSYKFRCFSTILRES